MTQTSLPWNGTTVGDAGPYADTDWHQLWQNIIGVGGMRSDTGVFLGSGTQPNDGLKVQAQSPAAAAVDVLNGAALVRGIFYLSDATEAFAVAANASGNPRIDTIVLRADYSLQTVVLAIKTGTPAASPVAPTMTQTPGVMWEIPISDIAVANGFVTITNANISPRQEWLNAAAGVYLDNVLNNSGGDLITGDVVIWDTTADRAVTTTTTQDNSLAAGVWAGKTANGAYGRVLTDGIGLIRTTAAVTRGNLLATSTTAKQAAAVAGLHTRVALALETTGGAGLALAYINVQRITEDYILIRDEKAQNTAGGTFTNGAFQKRDLNTKVVDTGGYASIAASVVTLQPGTYRFQFSAPAQQVGVHLARLRNTSDTINYYGTSENSGAAAGTRSIGHGRFTITAAKNFELQHCCATTVATVGYGAASNFGPEAYSVLEFWREGPQ